jgi:hypothetical protein
MNDTQHSRRVPVSQAGWPATSDPADADHLPVLARHAATNVPAHGTGSLPHGYVEGTCGDYCNNLECPVRETHERCTIDCLTAAGPRLLEVPAWRLLPFGRPVTADDLHCRGCDCDDQPPRDPDDPGAYPGPDPDCDCLHHEDGQPL